MNNEISIEESNDFATNMPFSALLMGEDALGSGDNEMSELTGGKDTAGPLFKLGQQDIVSW